MSFEIYLFGYLILIAGLAIGANILNVPAAVDRRGRSLFGRRSDHPWRDGNPTKGSTVQGLAASRAGLSYERWQVNLKVFL